MYIHIWISLRLLSATLFQYCVQYLTIKLNNNADMAVNQYIQMKQTRVGAVSNKSYLTEK